MKNKSTDDKIYHLFFLPIQINTREQVSDLLQLGKYIDLVIPRGSNDLVRSVQKQSVQIPVLGHAEGICHVYIDKEANLDMALRIGKSRKDWYLNYYFLVIF